MQQDQDAIPKMRGISNLTSRKAEEDQKLPEEPAMATRRNSGEEIRVPGGLRTVRDEDPLEEAAAAGSWGVGRMRGNNPNSPRPLRCSRPPYPGCPVD